MKKVDLYKLHDDNSSSVVVTFYLENGEVKAKGEEQSYKNVMRNGIVNYLDEDTTRVLPKDGLKFLKNLQFYFKSGYYQATEVIEE